MANSPKQGFPETRKFAKPVKNRAKFVKKLAVPKSANYKTGKQGDWGKSNG